VHRSVARALCGLALCWPLRVSADWTVRRQGTAALREQAVERLVESPDDGALAARVVELAGRESLEEVLARLKAGAAKGGYGPVMAYAQVLLAASRAEDAAAAFERAMGLQPARVAPALGRARALERAQRNEPALDAYQEAIRRERRPAARKTLLAGVAALAARTGALAREIEARRAVVALAPGDARLVAELARALGRADRAAEGATLLDRALESDRGLAGSARAELARQAAALKETTGDDAGAEQLLRASLAARPASDAERLDLYQHLLRIGRRRETLPELDAWLERAAAAPGGSRLPEWQALAELREDLGNYEGALEAWKRVSALVPGSLPPRRRVLALLDRLGRSEELGRTYDELARQAPEDLDLLLEIVEARWRRGDKEEARRRFGQVLQRFRRRPQALVRLADLASRWGDDDRVLESWDAMLALDPRDERAIVGLGEAHFQRGRRELARRTWYGLLRAVRPVADAHGRLAELLGDHEMLDEAVAEARAAQKLEPTNPSWSRALARILERKKDFAGAVSEWRAALQKSTGPARTSERREARARIVNLLAREGRERLRAETVLLKDRARRHPEDRETALFLAELQLRLQEPNEAVQTLAATADRLPKDAEIVLLLVRLLRQSRQTERAISWLERLGGEAPARTEEALLQIAEIRLGQYEDGRALESAQRALAHEGENPDALLRVADLEERAGQSERALATYRRALARAVSTRAALGAARLLARAGDAEQSLKVLRAAAASAPDAETRGDLRPQELELAEFLGELPELLRSLSALSDGESAAERKLCAEILRRMLPPVYQAGADGKATAERRALARRGLRTVLDLLTDPAAEPDPALIELAGMLGNRDATPVLLRLAQPASEPGRPSAGGASMPAAAGVPLAAVIGLGRLGDRRALPSLLALASSADAGLRAAAVWALGRLGAREARPALEQAAEDPRADVAALAFLGLGRLREAALTEPLLAAATDLLRPVDVRRAAVFGLALADASGAAPRLVPLLDSAEPRLAAAAAASLGILRERATLPALWRRALIGEGAGAAMALAALRWYAGSAGLADEAPALRRDRVPVGALLDALAAGPSADADLEPLWIEHLVDVEDLLVQALEGRPAERGRALAALDTRAEGLGLGRLLAAGPPSRAAQRALDRLAAPVRAALGPLLEDPERSLRLRAISLAAKLRDERLGPGHLMAALAAVPTGLETPSPDAEATALLAAQALLAGRAGAAGVLEGARASLLDPAWQRRLAAVRVARLAGAPAAELLRGALADASAFVRAEAAAGLSVAAAGGPALVRASSDPSAAVRAATAPGLRRRTDAAARAALERLAGDESASVREAVAAALGPAPGSTR
jgi:tetratricopeptide (TPR) repeat protein